MQLYMYLPDSENLLNKLQVGNVIVILSTLTQTVWIKRLILLTKYLIIADNLQMSSNASHGWDFYINYFINIQLIINGK